MRILPPAVQHCFTFLRHYGLRITIREAMPYISEVLFRSEGRAEAHEDFDARFGTDTSGELWPWELPSIRHTGREVFGYEPVSAQRLSEILDHIPIAPEQYTFVDLGSGKGRAVLVASRYPFKEIIGIEISSELCTIARKNVKLYRPPEQVCRNIEILNLDALEYKFPASPLIVFMYRPFGENTLMKVIANLSSALELSNNPSYVIYVNPQLEALLRKSPILQKVPTPKWYSVYQAHPSSWALCAPKSR